MTILSLGVFKPNKYEIFFSFHDMMLRTVYRKTVLLLNISLVKRAIPSTSFRRVAIKMRKGLEFVGAEEKDGPTTCARE